MFGWSLYEIDRTDIESLLPFVMHAPKNNHGAPMSTSDTETQSVVTNRKNRVFCDQVNWL
jgi:hypothetical protein